MDAISAASPFCGIGNAGVFLSSVEPVVKTVFGNPMAVLIRKTRNGGSELMNSYVAVRLRLRILKCP